jgi:tetratricopeptide (TPR) repeat protein
MSAETEAKEDTPQWDAVESDAQAALVLDATLVRAQDLADRAREEQSEPPPRWTTALRDNYASWTSWLKAPGGDLLGRLLAALTIALGLLLVARLLLLLDVRPPRVPAVGWVTLGTSLLSGIGIVALLASAWNGPQPWRALFWIPLLGINAVLLWSLLFHRLRVSVDMQSAGDHAMAGATSIVAHLRSLGAEPPKGLEIPLGADVATLGGSKITTSLGSWASSLLALVQGILGVTPWRVLVDIAADGTVSVIVSRHGRSVASHTITKQPLGPGGPEVDPLIMVAALVLTTLADAYGDKSGFAGATSWRSIGLQYAGSRHLLDGVGERAVLDGEALALLEAAANDDPPNLNAQYSWWMARFRKETDPASLDVARQWMSEHARDLNAIPALAARMRYAALVFARNGGEGEWMSAASELQLAIQALEDSEAHDHRPASGQGLVRQLKEAYGALVNSTGETPNALYSRACNLARTGFWDEAVAMLGRLKSQDPELNEWLYKDPELAVLRTQAVFLDNFAKQPPAVIEATPFASYRSILKERRLLVVALIAAMTPGELQERLDISGTEAEYLNGWAGRVSSLPSGLAPIASVIISAALDNGIGPAGPAPMTADIVAAITATCLEQFYVVPAELPDWPGWLE